MQRVVLALMSFSVVSLFNPGFMSQALFLSGPILIVEDDADDQFILERIFQELVTPNERIYFQDGTTVLEYLKTMPTHPLIIISDINLPVKNGIQLKKQIDQDPVLRKKSIPFVFMSTAIDKKTVTQAYLELTIQGFFQKSTDYDDLKRSIKLILDYWIVSKHPNAL